MTRQIIILLTALALWTTGVGQTNKFDIGIEGGPSWTSLRGNDYLEENNDPTTGYSGGLTFQYNFPKFLSLRTSIAYERKGVIANFQGTDENGNPNSDITIHSNFDYLTMPLLVRFTFGRKLTFFVNGGTFYGFLIKHSTVVDAVNESPKSIWDNTETMKRFDFGLTGGLGGGLQITNNFLLTLEIRHNLGLYNISELPIDNDGTIQTNSTNLLIGFAYRLGTRDKE